MDLAKLVSGGGQAKGVYKNLAYKIGSYQITGNITSDPVPGALHLPDHACLNAAGKEVYVDIQGWHLFLKDITVQKDIKMDQV